MNKNWMKKRGPIAIFLSIGLFTFGLFYLFHWMGQRNRAAEEYCEDLYGRLIILQKELNGLRADDLNRLEDHLVLCRKKFQESMGTHRSIRPFAQEKKPAKEADFFLAAGEVQKDLQTLAEQFQVLLPNGPSFGFSDCIRLGSLPDSSLDSLQRQLEETATLLHLLFSYSEGDLQFESIQRESAQKKALASYPTDLFDGRDAPTLRPLLGQETHLYRLKFRCHTGTFRNFLNALEEHLLPAVPRSLSVLTPTTYPGADDRDRWIVVDPQLSSFTLLVEWVQLSPNENSQPKD
jgi:hypothetical protein